MGSLSSHAFSTGPLLSLRHSDEPELHGALGIEATASRVLHG
jgi:hypothetical protein